MRPGDHLILESATQEWVERLYTGGDPNETSDGPTLDMTVTGIVVSPLVFVAPVGVMYLTQAFSDTYRDKIANFPRADIRLDDEARAEKMAATGQLESGDPELDAAITMVSTPWGAGEQVTDGLRVVGIGLWIFCSVVALAGLAAVVLLVRRLARSMATDFEVLGALGQDRSGRASCGLALAAPVVAVSTVGTLVGAIALTPYTRIGLAGQVEPDRGLFIDGPLLLVGIAVLAVVALAGTVPSFMSSGRRAVRSPGGQRFPAVNHPLSLTLGVRHALSGRDRRVPSHTTLVVGTCLMTTAVASLVFGASLARLPDRPDLWGGGSDVVMDFGESDQGQPNEPYDQALQALGDDERVSALTGMTRFTPEIDGLSIWSVALDTRRGEPIYTVLDGRVPRSPDEIGLGRGTMERLGLQLGDEVPVDLAGTTELFRLVGQVAFPIGETAIDEGAIISTEGSRRFPGFTDAIEGYQASLTWATGVDEQPAVDGLVEQGYPVLSPRPPPVVAHLGQVDRLPGLLALFFAVLGLATVAYLLSVSARVRRRQLAVLTALGLPPRHGPATLRWQAVTIGVIASLVGIPAGVILGRAVWAAVAHGAGVVVAYDLPIAALFLALGIAVVGSLVITVVVGLSVRRRPVAEALRAD